MCQGGRWSTSRRQGALEQLGSAPYAARGMSNGKAAGPVYLFNKSQIDMSDKPDRRDGLELEPA